MNTNYFRLLIHSVASAVLCGACASAFSQVSTGNTANNFNSTQNASNQYNSGTSYNTNSSSSGSGPFGKRNGNNRFASQSTDLDAQKSNDARDRNRTKNSNATGTKNSKGTPAPGSKQGTTTVKGSAPARKGAAVAAGAAHGATNVEFKIKADPTKNLLYIESVGLAPTMNIVAPEGENFDTRVMIRDAKHAPFKSLDVSLKYDPQVLRPKGIDDSAITPLVASPPIARMDARRGVIAYHAELNAPLSSEFFQVFKIEWETLKSSDNTPITFLNTTNFPSRVLNGDVDILQTHDDNSDVEPSPTAGLLGAEVEVTPKRTREWVDAEEDAGIGGIALASSISEGTARGGVELSLRPRATSLKAGDQFLVDVVFNNPRRAELDMVKLKIRFDPKVLEVVDYDEDNWIAKDVNIYDGQYHDDLPFDFHMRDVAYNSTGEIYYEMGFSKKQAIPSSGVIATIKFHALAPAPSTTVAFDLDESDKQARTAISFLGFNLIGSPGQRSDSLTNAALQIY